MTSFLEWEPLIVGSSNSMGVPFFHCFQVCKDNIQNHYNFLFTRPWPARTTPIIFSLALGTDNISIHKV